ncbi:MAG: hypothetical protein K6F96_05760 [Bacteroidales bacterium]|jgi:hypothetical protein|nr:hypothetical protein [Bacteroidales bacterium]
MKKIVLTFIAMLIVGLASTCAQNVGDTIVADGNKFYYHGMRIESMRQMKSIVANDVDALKEVKKANAVVIVADVLGYIGGFAVGYEVAGLFFDNFNPYILGAGLAVAGAGIGITFAANKHLKKGVAIYNQNLGKTPNGDSVQLDFGLTPGGVGLTLRF